MSKIIHPASPTKDKVLRRLSIETEVLETLAMNDPNPSFGGYVFTVDVFNSETIYQLEKHSGSIILSMTEDVPEDDPVWEMAAKVLGIE